jgi:hypothetical protein
MIVNLMPKGMVLDMPATLALNTWAGRRTYQIRIIGETRENFRFVAQEAIPMPRNRWLKAGEQGRVPKSAIVLNVAFSGCRRQSAGTKG